VLERKTEREHARTHEKENTQETAREVRKNRFARVRQLFSYMAKRCKYGLATISRLLKIAGLFCKRALYKRRYFAKETYNLKEPTNRSHPISEHL